MCVCVSCTHVPMVIWRAPRCAEGGEPRRLLLLLSLLCAAFSLLPLLPEAEHRGLCVCLSVSPACFLPVALGCDRYRRRPGAATGCGMGAISQKCARARGRPPARAAGWPAPTLAPISAAVPAPPCTRRGPARAHLTAPGCISLFLLLSVTLGWKQATKRGDARKS